MDPLFTPILLAAIWAGVAAGIYVVVYFADLTFGIISGWFKNFAYLLVENDRRAMENREYLAFTIKTAMATKDYNIVQGIFDTKNQKIYDARAIKTDSIDSKIKEVHSYGRKEVALWQ